MSSLAGRCRNGPRITCPCVSWVIFIPEVRSSICTFDLATGTVASLWVMMIHPTAIVHSQAKLDPTVRVGPYAIIDEGVEVGPGCIIGPQVYLTGLTKIGARNRFYAGCVIGEAPQ